MELKFAANCPVCGHDLSLVMNVDHLIEAAREQEDEEAERTELKGQDNDVPNAQ